MSNEFNIDITSDAGTVETPSDNNGGISIDAVTGNVVDMSSMNITTNRSRHTVVKPKTSNESNTKVEVTTNRPATNNTPMHGKTVIRPNVTTNANTRKAVSINEMPTTPEPDRDADIPDSIEAELLDFNNPNSVINTYIKRNVQEMQEWTAEQKKKAQEKQTLEDDEAIVNEIMGEDESEVIDITKSDDEDDKSKVVTIAEFDDKKPDMTIGVESENLLTEDLSSLFNKKEEATNIEEVNEPMSEVVNNTTDELDDLIPEMPEEAKTPAVEVEDEVDEVVKEDAVEEELEEVDDPDSIKIENAAVKNPESKKEEKKDEGKFLEMDVDTNFDGTFAVVEESDEVDEDKEAKEAEEANRERLKHLQKLAIEKLKPVSQKLDISSFTIVKKPVIDVKNSLKADTKRTAKWVLPYQEAVIHISEFSGAELEKLREFSQSRTADSYTKRFKMIYDHITSSKATPFEAWLKCTPWRDVDHIYFAIYIASYKGANYLPVTCPNKDCNEQFLTDNLDIMKMVKFDDDKAMNKFSEIYQSEETAASGSGMYCSEMVPLNDKIAITFREPSIADVIEIMTLERRQLDKFSSTITALPYIDKIYLIDMESKSLTPVSYKMYPDNPTKTTVSKIAKYDSVLGTLNGDGYSPIQSYIRAIEEKTVGINYLLPSVNCPKCGSVTNEVITTAEDLVFTRYQLGALTTTSLN